MTCIPRLIDIELPPLLSANWGTRVDQVVTAVSASTSTCRINHGIPHGFGQGSCPCRAVSLATCGSVCGEDADLKLCFRKGYLCAVGCWLSKVRAMPQHDFYALAEHLRRAMTAAVGAPTVLRHPHGQAEITYRWQGEAQHVQMLVDEADGQRIVIVANDPWVCSWCTAH